MYSASPSSSTEPPVSWFERWIARNCDLVTTITQSDAALFAANAPGVAMLPLVPGYDGPRLAERTIGPVGWEPGKHG